VKSASILSKFNLIRIFFLVTEPINQILQLLGEGDAPTAVESARVDQPASPEIAGYLESLIY
jgi:hypothetical protein